MGRLFSVRQIGNVVEISLFGSACISLSIPVFLYLLYSAVSGRNVPRRSARSFINTKKTGTRIST